MICQPLPHSDFFSLWQIALEVGYANPSHFSQLFRRETGLSPGDHRWQR